jgi:hypothetical protein
MGAEQFEEWVTPETDVRKAFSQAVSDARYSHGNEGYTGSIAEKDQFVVLTERVLSEEQAQAMIRDLMNKDDERIRDKWGPAGAIPFGICKAPTIEKSLKFRLDGLPGYDEILRRVGEELHDILGVANVKVKTKWRTEVTTTPGDARMVYRVVSARGGRITGSPDFDTQAGARAFMDKYLRDAAQLPSGSGGHVLDLSVVGMKVRPDTEALVSGKNIPIHTDVSLTVRIAPELKSPIEQKGWVFFGWASS